MYGVIISNKIIGRSWGFGTVFVKKRKPSASPAAKSPDT